MKDVPLKIDEINGWFTSKHNNDICKIVGFSMQKEIGRNAFYVVNMSNNTSVEVQSFYDYFNRTDINDLVICLKVD